MERLFWAVHPTLLELACCTPHLFHLMHRHGCATIDVQWQGIGSLWCYSLSTESINKGNHLFCQHCIELALLREMMFYLRHCYVQGKRGIEHHKIKYGRVCFLLTLFVMCPACKSSTLLPVLIATVSTIHSSLVGLWSLFTCDLYKTWYPYLLETFASPKTSRDKVCETTSLSINSTRRNLFVLSYVLVDAPLGDNFCRFIPSFGHPTWLAWVVAAQNTSNFLQSRI